MFSLVMRQMNPGLLLTRAALARRLREVPAVSAEVAGLELEVVSDMAGFEALEDDWNDLFERAGASHQLFQSYNWTWHWCRTYVEADAGSSPLRILVGRQDGRTVMIWPLTAKFKYGIWQFCWMGDPVSQYSDVLVEAGPDRMRWLRDGWRFLETETGADLICLPKVRADSALADLLRDQGIKPSAETDAPYADLAAAGDYDTYAQRFSSRDRKNRGRQWRRLSERGVAEIEVVTEAAEARAIVEQVIELKRRWLRQRGLVSKAFVGDGIQNFFGDALASVKRPVDFRVLVLRVDGEIAAAEIGVVCNGRYASHVSAYSVDPKFAQSGAGALVRDASIRHCLEEGLASYDLMAPNDAYKYEWADAGTKVHDYVVSLSAAGRVCAELGACAHAAVKSTFQAAPGPMRRMIATLATASQ